MKIRKPLIVLSLVMVFAMIVVPALFAGGGAQAGGTGQSNDKLLYWVNNDDTNSMKQIVDYYNSNMNPNGLPVEVQVVPGDVTDVSKLMTAVRGGTGPDVYFLDRFTIGERAAGGLLEDITDNLKALDPNLKDKYLDFAWNETQFRGKTYGLPWYTDTRVIYYRKDLLRQAGIDVSVLDPKNGPMTVKDMQDIGYKMNQTDAAGNYTRMGLIPFAREFQGYHYIWGFAFGGQFADLNAGKVTCSSDPGVIAAFQYFHDSAKAMDPQKVRTFLSTYAPPNLPPQQDAFIIGKLTMIVNGDWYLYNIHTYGKDIEWGATWLPVLKKGDTPGSFAGGWSVVVPTGAKHKADAVKFIYWLAGDPGQRMMLKLNGGTTLSTVKTVLNDDSVFSPDMAFLRQMLPYSKSRPVLPVGALYFDNLTIAQDAVAYDQADVMQALKTCEDNTNAQLQKFLPLN